MGNSCYTALMVSQGTRSPFTKKYPLASLLPPSRPLGTKEPLLTMVRVGDSDRLRLAATRISLGFLLGRLG